MKKLYLLTKVLKFHVFFLFVHLVYFCYIGVKDDKRIQTGFCIKGVTQVSNYDMDWPKGDYCILKYGNQCPDGKLNDENDENRIRRSWWNQRTDTSILQNSDWHHIYDGLDSSNRHLILRSNQTVSAYYSIRTQLRIDEYEHLAALYYLLKRVFLIYVWLAICFCNINCRSFACVKLASLKLWVQKERIWYPQACH